MSSNKKSQGLKRIMDAYGYSLDGLHAAFSETAFKQELVLTAIAIPAIIFIDTSKDAKALMGSSIILILIAELINTAIETIIDRIAEKPHKLSKKAKDIGSAIVLLAFINAAYVWCMVLF